MLPYSHIPLLYHPTNVVLLDDDPKFLNNISLLLPYDMPYVLDSDPQKIMHYLKTHAYEPDTLSALVTEQVFDRPDNESTHETFVIDFSKLQETLNLPMRFKKSTVGMIDRFMQSIDGTDFCRAIQKNELPIRRILFTGKTNADEAVNLFNHKVIDGFLVKQSGDMLAENIATTIYQHSWQQFLDLGKSLGGLLSHILKPLSDEQFIKIFNRVRQQYAVIEFYLLDSSCSFLLLDAKGHAKQLLVRNNQDFKDCYDIAKDSEAPYGVLQALRDHQMFPYTKNPMGYARLQGDAWDEMMVAMEKIPGRELYFTIIDRPDIEAYSFEKYLQEEWPNP